MKHKISISVDEKTILQIRAGIRNKIFRNRSHAFEYAINKILEEAKK